MMFQTFSGIFTDLNFNYETSIRIPFRPEF
jgi:hypothetical protein